jgi:alanine racemase
MAVVKANGYGHGLREVTATFASGTAVFAVASLAEALQLRKTERQKPILLLSAALPGEYPEIGRKGFIPTISSLEEALLFSRTAPKGAPVHFKIDTGMGRLGALPREALAILREIRKLPLTLHSLSTHLAEADSNRDATERQLRHFETLLTSLRKEVPGTPVHVLNSAGTLLHPHHTHDLVRVGLALYGISPIERFQRLLKPALNWKASVTLIRDLPKGHGISYGSTFRTPRAMRIAVLPVGYADGYPRQLSGKGAAVLIGGKRCPVLGRVTMNQILVDVSGLPQIRTGDVAVLVGKQGREEITATEIARLADTIPWHLFCGITGRVEFVHTAR